MKIVIEAIPQSAMRVSGWGDWYWADDTLHIRSVIDDQECDAFLVAFHELTEAWLCKLHGVDEKAVDTFDSLFETEEHPEEEAPGDDPRAPYRREHRCAMLIEHMMAHFMGMDDYGVVR